MASSRWKRFAFFDRHTLSIPDIVMDELMGESLALVDRSSRRSHFSDSAEADGITMAVTTAALPMDTKPLSTKSIANPEDGYNTSALPAMWSSLMACTNPSSFDEANDTVHLPSQVSQLMDNTSNNNNNNNNNNTQRDDNSKPVLDGLVLVFLASRESTIVQCIDITVRCNPSSSNGSAITSTSTVDEDSMDGWRGYFTPFVKQQPQSKDTPSSTNTTVEDRIISDHLGSSTTAPSLGNSAGPGATAEPLMGISTCHSGKRMLLACISDTSVVVYENPHLALSCRLPLSQHAIPSNSDNSDSTQKFVLATPWSSGQGKPTCVDITAVDDLVAVGMDSGEVRILQRSKGFLRTVMTIPPPNAGSKVTTVQLSVSDQMDDSKKQVKKQIHVFVGYHHSYGGGGMSCFDLGTSPVGANKSPSARHDLDSRPVPSARLSSFSSSGRSQSQQEQQWMVARNDGLYTYSHTQKVGVAPIDGTKLAICHIPSMESPTVASQSSNHRVGASYALVASMDTKSGRETVDIYDATNKLVAFHVLLSPGHKTLRVAGVTTPPTRLQDGSIKAGRSSAIVMTSGGAIVTLTEKMTTDKVGLLVQKNLYSAAISMAFADPSYQAAEITSLYRRHAEHLYRKGDFAGAIEQYIFTIGSLESSHVIFRYLDAPKIPMLAKYLEELRQRNLATSVHNELLRTCYLKLNDTEAAEKIAASAKSGSDSATSASVVASLTHNPKEALATICTFPAPRAAEALVAHGAALARALPRESAGVVVSLCLGTYSPSALAEAATKAANEASKMLEYAIRDEEKKCRPYPIHLFASAFMENPKMLRLILAHCNRNKCYLPPNLRRTLLELTLAEWNTAKRNSDTEAEKLRRKEAITALTDAHCHEIGDYDALVIVQMAGFAEGELLLYERLQMVPMLLSRYAQDGGDRARRQMLAMCRNDPEILADVLGHFVAIAAQKVHHEQGEGDSVASEEEEILDDIREALAMAKSQGVLPPVRIARILAGEGVGQFKTNKSENKRTVPLAVALDYVGDILDESRGEISRLRAEVEEYNELCNTMEAEVEALLSGKDEPEPLRPFDVSSLDIDEMYSRLRSSMEDGPKTENKAMQVREAFWREMNQSDDRFETITRFLAKGIIP